MAVGPRVVFVRFQSSESPKLKPWVAHVRQVLHEVEGTLQTPKTKGSVVWQIVSANNRELARGADVHESFDEARATARELGVASASLTIGLVSEPAQGLYGWYLSLDGRPVATCARWYTTDRDRRNSILLAMRSIPVATPSAGARLTDPSLMADDRGSLV